CGLPLHAQVVINEVLYRTDAASGNPSRGTQYVELYNKGTDPVDLTGWAITGRDPTASARRFFGVVLPPQTYLVVHFGTGSDNLDFANNAGDLYTQDAAPILDSEMDEVALYSPSTIVDFVAWSSNAVAYAPGYGHADAVAASIWSPGAALNS